MHHGNERPGKPWITYSASLVAEEGAGLDGASSIAEIDAPTLLHAWGACGWVVVVVVRQANQAAGVHGTLSAQVRTRAATTTSWERATPGEGDGALALSAWLLRKEQDWTLMKLFCHLKLMPPPDCTGVRVEVRTQII